MSWLQFHEETIGQTRALRAVGNPSCSISLFHGYGASMADLAPLADYIRQVTDATLYFPNGPLQVPIGPGWFGSAWFPIDFVELEKLRTAGGVRDLSQALPAGFDHARAVADSFYADISNRHEKNIIGGFSQGAMLATDLMLRSEKLPAGLIILSGTLVAENEWRPMAMKRAGYCFYQSHGRQDMILPYFMAQRLNKMLNECGLQGELVSFEGGHEIPQTALSGMLQYIQQILDDNA